MESVVQLRFYFSRKQKIFVQTCFPILWSDKRQTILPSDNTRYEELKLKLNICIYEPGCFIMIYTLGVNIPVFFDANPMHPIKSFFRMEKRNQIQTFMTSDGFLIHTLGVNIPVLYLTISE